MTPFVGLSRGDYEMMIRGIEMRIKTMEIIEDAPI